MCGFYCLYVAVELVQLFKIAKIITDADGRVDAFGFADAERAAKIGLLYGRHFGFGLLNVVRIEIDKRVSVISA